MSDKTNRRKFLENISLSGLAAVGSASGINKALTYLRQEPHITQLVSWLIGGNRDTNPPEDFLGTIDDKPLVIKTNNVERTRVTGAGDVGIGTPDPWTALHVKGRISTGQEFESAGAITFFPPDGKAWFHIDNGPAGRDIGQLRISYGGNPGDNEVLSFTQNKTVIVQTGKIGIGTASPNAALSVQAKTKNDGNNTAEFRATEIGENASHVHWGSTGDWYIRSASSGGKVILQDSGGLVGIGTSEPRTPLHVHGRISTGRDQQSAGAITFFPPDGRAWFHIDNGPTGGRPIGRLRISYGGNPGDNEVVSITQNGKVGIGPTKTNPEFTLDVAGEVHALDFLITSDARLKTNVSPLIGVLEKLDSIRGVSFQWNQDPPSPERVSKGRQIGVIAQELQSVYPELVRSAGEEGYMAVDYDKLTAVLLEAVKELRAENETKMRMLEQEFTSLREEIRSLQ